MCVPPVHIALLRAACCLRFCSRAALIACLLHAYPCSHSRRRGNRHTRCYRTGQATTAELLKEARAESEARERVAVDAAVADALAMSLRRSRLERVAERQSELDDGANPASRLERAADWVSHGGHAGSPSPHERMQAGLDGAAAWLAAHGSEQGHNNPANSVAYAATLAANSISSTYANAYAASLANEAEAAQKRAARMSPIAERALELD